jgi:hypothetical protein
VAQRRQVNTLKNPKATWLAWGLCGVTLVLLAVNFPTLAAYDGTALTPLAQVNDVLFVLYLGVFAVVGALIIANQPRNTIGWLLMFNGLSFAILGFIPPLAQLDSLWRQGALSPALVTFFAWVNGWTWWVLIGPPLLMLQLFPTGRPLSPRWRWGIVLLAVTFLYFIVLYGLGPFFEDTASDTVIPNPIAVIALEDFELVLLPFYVLLVSTALLSATAVVLRYMRGNFIERQQLKWFLSAGALFVIVYLTSIFVSPEGSDLNYLLFNLIVFAFPVAIGIAILRYRLFDIDLIIRRTLTYALVTGLLAIVFFGSVVLLQLVFFNLVGTDQNELVTVLSTLAIAALFTPVRNRIQSEIDKRFNRKKYDTQQVLNDFAKTVRDETDLGELTARLMQVVDNTMQPRTVSVWLKDANAENHKQ